MSKYPIGPAEFTTKVGMSRAEKEKQKQEIFDDVVNKIPSGTPKLFATESEILASLEDKGIAVATDTGKWYYWNGTNYVDSGKLYQAVGIDDGSITTEKIIDGAVTPIKTSFMHTSPNLYDYRTSRKGFYLDGYGNDVANASFFASDFIQVKPNTTYGISGTRSEEQSTYIEFDENYTYLTSLIRITNNTFTTSSKTKYIKIDGHITRLKQIMLNEGKLQPFKEYGSYLKDEYIKDESITPFKTNFVDVSTNLYNKLNNSQGYYINGGNGVLVENASFTTSEFIRVKPNKLYSLTIYSVTNANGFRRIGFYDDSQNFISKLDATENKFTTPSNCAYIRLDANNYALNGFEMLNEGNVLLPFEPFYIKFKNMPLINTIISNYYEFDDSIVGGELFKIYLKVSVKNDYLQINFKHDLKPYIDGGTNQNGDCWRIYEAFSCKIVDGSVTDRIRVVTAGAWETAISLKGYPDFIGTLHGYEHFKDLKILIDGKQTFINRGSIKLTPFNNINIIYQADLIEQGTRETIAARVFRIYNFEKNYVECKQRFFWLKNYNVNNAFLTMLPIIRDENGVQITDHALTDKDYLVYDVSKINPDIAIGKQTPNVKWAEIYGTNFGIKAETNVEYKDTSIPNYYFLATTATVYNKFYYSYSTDTPVKANDEWFVKTTWKFNIDR